jgi:hypothetical protein
MSTYKLATFKLQYAKNKTEYHTHSVIRRERATGGGRGQTSNFADPNIETEIQSPLT